jgi:F like protein
MLEVRGIIASVRPVLAQSLSDSIIGAWISGGESALNKLGSVLPPPAQPPSGGPPTADIMPPPDEPDPVVRFPGIDNAANRILESRTISPANYYGMRQRARQEAFTISGNLEDAAVDKIRVLLGENVRDGANLKAFESAVAEALPKLAISEAHLENVFRTNTLTAFSDGHEATFQAPIVADAFPFRAYFSTHDDRTRIEHEQLEELGMDGTNVYLADDPTWLKFRPPWDWQCRCRWIPYTIRQAARKGVTMAVQWLDNIKQAKIAGVYSGDDSDYRPNAIYVAPPPFNPPVEFQR